MFDSRYVNVQEENCSINVYISEPGKEVKKLLTIPYFYVPLNEEFIDYVEDAVKEIKATSYTLNLCFPTDKNYSDTDRELLKARIHQYFVFKADKAKKRLHENFRQTAGLFVYGFVFMLICMLIRGFFSGYPDDSIFNSIREGLLVLGWVALWCPFEKLLFEWIPLKKELNICKRLASMKTECISKNLQPN